MRRRVPAQLSWLAGLLSLYLVAPFAAGLCQSGLADWRAVDWPTLGDACAVSLVSATLATALVALGGIPLGYLLARSRGRLAALLGFTVQLPLALPPLSSGTLLLFLVGYASPIGRLTHGALTDSFAGIVLAEAFVAAPFLIIAARSAFADLDPALEDVAATLGHRPWAIFTRVSLPIAWRPIAAGMLLAWLRGFGEFGATVMVAYHPYSLPVYTYVAFGSQGLPAMLPVLLPTLLAAMAVMLLAASIRTPTRRPSPANQPDLAPHTPLPPTTAGRSRPPRSLSFAFQRALDGFDLDVAWRTQASRIAILGASGSGKSMTLRLIAGLDRDRSGTVALAGRDLSNTPPDQRRIAWVPQNYGLFPHLQVDQQVRFAVGANPTLAQHWLQRLGLAGLAHRFPDALSLGQRQRVALARFFSRPADLLLLDEPFSALDAPLRASLQRQFLALQAEIDATTILVTHDPQEAFLLADELLILDTGRVLQAGPAAAVFARPANETVARLLGADIVAQGTALADHHIAIGNEIRLHVAGPALQHGIAVGWSAPPDAIRIAADGDYPGTIQAIDPPFGGRCRVRLRIGHCDLLAAVDSTAPVAPGPCRASINPAAVQVWPLQGQSLPSPDEP